MKNCPVINPCGITLTGKVKTANEDSFLYTNEPEYHNNLAIIADGISGNPNGDIASRLCCQFFYEIWVEKKAMFIASVKNMEIFMRNTLNEVNHRIFELNCQKGRLHNPMGTTVVCAAIMPKDIVIIHAGDSRFYEFNSKNKLSQITVDNTLLQKNYDLFKNIQSELIQNYEMLNFITKSVGTSEAIEDDEPKSPLVNIIKRHSDSRYMLCSDGLTHMVNDERITTILKNTVSNKKAVTKLIAASFGAGAADNLSIIIF